MDLSEPKEACGAQQLQTPSFAPPSPARRSSWELTFSWLKESILFMAVSRAVTISRNLGSCSQSGLDSKSDEIFTADFDIAVVGTESRKRGRLLATRAVQFSRGLKPKYAALKRK